MKYALKWGISYRGKTYITVYGKRKAHELLYILSMNVTGLSVVAVQPRPRPRRKKRAQEAAQLPEIGQPGTAQARPPLDKPPE